MATSLILSLTIAAVSCSRHQPFNQTWSVTSYLDGKVLYSTTRTAPLDTFFPTLKFNLTDIMEPGPARYPCGQGKVDFYVCPSTRGNRERARQCGGTESAFCASWGCESQASWLTSPKPDALIFISRDPLTMYNCDDYPLRGHNPRTPIPPCNGLLITFTDKGKIYSGWTSGVDFGVKQYLHGTDYGGVLTIKLQATPSTPPVKIGPNLAIPSAVNNKPSPKPLPTETSSDTPPTVQTPIPFPIGPPSTKDSMLSLLSATFHTLNQSNPNITQSCWLCLSAIPPFYEGIATSNGYSIVQDITQCRWQHNGQGKITLQAVSGSGLCLGPVPVSHRHLCNQIITPQNNQEYLIPNNNTWWACSDGLTPCVYAPLLDNSFCVQVSLIPKVSYLSNEQFFHSLLPDNASPDPFLRQRRELITTLTVATLLGLGATGTGVGITSLVLSNRYYYQLQEAIDEDIKSLEGAISHLQESMSSLAEVVLQNRRGLDLLFLQQGGLCAALEEECCFYVNHSGVIKDSLAKVRDRLEKRRKLREQNQDWIERWFKTPPWLSTLLPSILGPLVGLLLLLTFGPWAFRKLTNFIKQQIDKALAKPIQIHYHRLAMLDQENLYDNYRGRQYNDYQPSIPTGGPH